MGQPSLVPGRFYWAQSSRHFDGKPMVVRVSTAFGQDPDYWTPTLLGSDQHAMPGEFEIIASIGAPDGIRLRHAAE